MTTSTLTLAEFLLARIAEDEAAARADVGPDSFYAIEDVPLGAWDWHRVLAECEAKRRIVERARHDQRKYDGERIVELADYTLRVLAVPYADHPDYRAEWRAH